MHTKYAMADIVALPGVLHQQVGARLRQLIVEGAIAPGAKLNERALAAQLSVSRTPLREAIRALAAEGLVDLLPNRGAVAAQPSAQEIADTFELVAGLEGMAGELAAERIDAAALGELRALHFEMRAAHARRDLPTYYRLNAVIHEQIHAAAGNPVLASTYRSVNARLQALRFRSNLDEAKWAVAVDEHEQMLALLASRDGPGLRALLVRHLDNKRDVVLSAVSAAAAEPARKQVRA